MCGRFTLTSSPDQLTALFGLVELTRIEPRYNIAPTQTVFAVRVNQAGEREPGFFRWGLIPSWADDPAIGNRMINARSETVADKPAFRSAFRKRRCLIPASGFYEWQKTGGQKQPYHIRTRDGQPFAFAGLWERWEKGGEPVESCTILTAEANDLMRPLHERMPVILHREDYDRWLDTGLQEPRKLVPLLVPYSGDELTAYPVSTQVNNARHDDARCVEPTGTDGPTDIFG
jgi:putative SOS response-associated peptidase YedK